MDTNNIVLNRLFTQKVFVDLINKHDNPVYGDIAKRYVFDAESKENGALISEIYTLMGKNYRNEYFYKNSLLNKILIKQHSLQTTTALTEIPIGKSKADFILINGKAIVYEIKTELDTFERLDSQINDYYRSFNHVCVVTCEDNYPKICSILNKEIGILILTNRNTLSIRREPIEYNDKLDARIIFKMLHKKEFENIIKSHYGFLPITSQVFYYEECYKMFANIPINKVYELALHELKKRNKIIIEEFLTVPYELKFLMYFSKFTKEKFIGLNQFLRSNFRSKYYVFPLSAWKAK